MATNRTGSYTQIVEAWEETGDYSLVQSWLHDCVANHDAELLESFVDHLKYEGSSREFDIPISDFMSLLQNSQNQEAWWCFPFVKGTEIFDLLFEEIESDSWRLESLHWSEILVEMILPFDTLTTNRTHVDYFVHKIAQMDLSLNNEVKFYYTLLLHSNCDNFAKILMDGIKASFNENQDLVSLLRLPDAENPNPMPLDIFSSILTKKGDVSAVTYAIDLLESLDESSDFMSVGFLPENLLAASMIDIVCSFKSTPDSMEFLRPDNTFWDVFFSKFHHLPTEWPHVADLFPDEDVIESVQTEIYESSIPEEKDLNLNDRFSSVDPFIPSNPRLILQLLNETKVKRNEPPTQFQEDATDSRIYARNDIERFKKLVISEVSNRPDYW